MSFGKELQDKALKHSRGPCKYYYLFPLNELNTSTKDNKNCDCACGKMFHLRVIQEFYENTQDPFLKENKQAIWRCGDEF